MGICCLRGIRVCTTERYIYAVLCGRWNYPEKYKGYPCGYRDEIEVYDWDGDFIRKFQTSVPFDAMSVSEDDKVLYFVGYPCIAEWGRVKFVGNVDKFGAYDAINAYMKGANDVTLPIDTSAIYALSDLSKPWTTLLQEKVL